MLQILRPKKAEQVATKVLNKLISDENKHRPVVIHGFSVGGYLYSHVLNLMVKQDRFSSVKERIRGQVLDSPVDFHGIPYGVSNAASENPFVCWLMQSSIEAYLAIFARYTTKVYLAHSHLFHNNPVRSPALFFFSKDDKVADVDTCQACADYWKNELNMTVSQQCFESSPHVSHFYVHNKEYTEAVKKFLRDLNIPVVTL